MSHCESYLSDGGELLCDADFDQLNPKIDIYNETNNSYFESNSGFTTAGLSIITSVDSLPNSFIFYRGITQWLC